MSIKQRSPYPQGIDRAAAGQVCGRLQTPHFLQNALATTKRRSSTSKWRRRHGSCSARLDQGGDDELLQEASEDFRTARRWIFRARIHKPRSSYILRCSRSVYCFHRSAACTRPRTDTIDITYRQRKPGDRRPLVKKLAHGFDRHIPADDVTVEEHGVASFFEILRHAAAAHEQKAATALRTGRRSSHAAAIPDAVCPLSAQ
jgi:hypothetical protein